MIKKLFTYLFIALLGIIYVPVLTIAPLSINAVKVNLSFTASNFAGRNRLLSAEVNMGSSSLVEFDIVPSDWVNDGIASYIEFYDSSHNSAGSFTYNSIYPNLDLSSGGNYVINKWDFSNFSGYTYNPASWQYFKISIDIHPNTATGQFIGYMNTSTYDVTPTGFTQLRYMDTVNYEVPTVIKTIWFKSSYPLDFYQGTDPIDPGNEYKFLYGWGLYDPLSGKLNKYNFNRSFYDYEYDILGGSVITLWPIYYYYSEIWFKIVDTWDGAVTDWNYDVVKFQFGDFYGGLYEDITTLPDSSYLYDPEATFIGWYENKTGTQIGKVNDTNTGYLWPYDFISTIPSVEGTAYDIENPHDYAFTLNLYARFYYHSTLTLYDGFTQFGTEQRFLYYPANITTLPTKTGYEFTGWYTRNNVKYGNFYNTAKTIWSFPNQPVMEVLNTEDYDGSENYLYSNPVDLKLYAHFTPSLGTEGFPTTGTPTAPLAIATFLADLGLYNFPGLMFIYVLVSLLVTGVLVALLKLDMLTIIIVNLVLTGIFLFSNLLPLYVAIILSIMYIVIIIMSINGKGGRMLNE